jgi:hypothetical protein
MATPHTRGWETSPEQPDFGLVLHHRAIVHSFSSLDSKPTCLLHGTCQLIIELLIRLVRWKVDTIEACVSLGQVVGVGVHLVDGE